MHEGNMESSEITYVQEVGLYCIPDLSNLQSEQDYH